MVGRVGGLGKGYDVRVLYFHESGDKLFKYVKLFYFCL